MFHKDFLIYNGGILANLLCYALIPDADIKSISLFLFFVNALPVYPLDGFNALKSVLSYFFPYYYTSKGMALFSLGITVGILVLGLFWKVDLFLVLSFGYLFLLNIDFVKKQKLLYKKFLVHKALYRYTYPIRKLKFHEKYLNYLYKYHEIEIHIQQKVISETELLKMEHFL